MKKCEGFVNCGWKKEAEDEEDDVGQRCLCSFLGFSVKYGGRRIGFDNLNELVSGWCGMGLQIPDGPGNLVALFPWVSHSRVEIGRAHV